MKTKLILIALLAASNLLVIPATAQQTKTTTKTTVKTKAKAQPAPAKKVTSATAIKAPATPLLSAEKMPKFPGGGPAMEQYFVKALSGFKFYQPSGATLNIVIDPSGKVTQAKIKEGYRKYENGLWLEYPEIDKTLEEAALAMPAWEPGMDKGKPVSVQQDLYVTIMSPEQAQEDADKVFTFVEQQPNFPGGEKAMMDYIKANLKYPEEAKANNQEGLVIVQFVVTRYGDITEPTILKGFAESANNETLRLVRNMPQWVPGKQNGRAVNVRYTLPVRFSL